ncbi:MAG: fumarate hydratase C-terminal domain-containing protein [Ardenticatenaceae bacterium]|nr:fumarate hydratase C-terminal domain-containing protein [Ardenticatenaceae bacterium]MCB9003391.1 fumarate hydratase C-terminal domain-containing protein [Ardenticatenaceae bacterium]
MHRLTVPISDEEIRDLHAGDTVYLNGVIVTGRDAAHKFMIEHFVKADAIAAEDQELHDELKRLLDGSVIYHCGPVVQKLDNGSWKFVAAGPTTSIREEVYQADVINYFNLKGVIGKGGMGANTLKACQEQPAVYFHAIGGAASLIAQSVTEVKTVHKLEFGVPEAMWVIEVEDFPVVVTMDSHGVSIHEKVEAQSKAKLAELLA